MKVFKVVEKTDEGLVSCCAVGRARVVYKVGEWVQAPSWLEEKGYCPLAFRSWEDANSFGATLNFKAWLVLEGIGQDEVKLSPVLDLGSLSRGSIVTSVGASWPKGTVMVKRLKLLPGE